MYLLLIGLMLFLSSHFCYDCYCCNYYVYYLVCFDGYFYCFSISIIIITTIFIRISVKIYFIRCSGFFSRKDFFSYISRYFRSCMRNSVYFYCIICFNCWCGFYYFNFCNSRYCVHTPLYSSRQFSAGFNLLIYIASMVMSFSAARQAGRIFYSKSLLEPLKSTRFRTTCESFV